MCVVKRWSEDVKIHNYFNGLFSVIYVVWKSNLFPVLTTIVESNFTIVGNPTIVLLTGNYTITG